MAKEEKYDRFQRIAQERKQHVIECLQTLGNCSDPASYAYDVKELGPIFQAIVEKLAEVWHRMNCHSPYPFVPFRLSSKSEFIIGGNHCRRDQMVEMTAVLEYLREGGSRFTALASVRERYAEQFGNELGWSYPFCHGDHMGCMILPVQEGVLCLPYSSLDSETYEQFDLEAAKLLTAEETKELTDVLLAQAAELYGVLSDLHQALQS